MIKANELRIGNWLHFLVKQNDDDKFPFKKATAVTAEQILAMTKIVPPYAISDFWAPIPLSPEILERCGFVGSRGVYSHKKTNRIELFTLLENKTLSIEDDFEDSINVKCPDYLHQMQNLYFALTGEELEVKM